jgi:hypothetical protein
MSDLDRREGETLQEHHDRLAAMDTNGLSVWALRHRADVLERARAALAKIEVDQAGPERARRAEGSVPAPLSASAPPRSAVQSSLERAQGEWRKLSHSERRDFLTWMVAQPGQGK